MMVLVLLCQSVSAQADSTGVIRGFVFDNKSGEAVPFAQVNVLRSNNSCSSDLDGFFRLNQLLPGSYTLCISSAGYENDTTRDVIVSAGKITQLQIKLQSTEVTEVGVVTPITVTPDQAYDPHPIRVEPTGLNKKRALIVGGTQGVLAIGSLIGLSQLWYKDYPRTSFHTFNDNREWLQMDKLGHLQTAYTTGSICNDLWKWTGMRFKHAAWIGGLTGFAYQSTIEILDGYSQGWGFSTGDILANATGSALFISQQLIWQEQRILPKFGFQRSGYAPYRPALLGSGLQEEIIKDYNGQTYWLSINVASFLGSETKFPRWLNVALGYGATGMTGGHSNPVMYNSVGNEITFNRYRQYYLSFDIDLRKIPVKSRFLRAVFSTINFLKIPAPGIELSQKGVRPLLFAF